jgi:branched-chain amino acid aminotransferase
MNGRLAEGSGENLFVVKNGVITTNQADDSILMGITRSAAIEIARELGLKVKMAPLDLDDLLDADEAFFTGTAAEITPINEVDGRFIGHGGRGAVTKRIQDVFFDVVAGRDVRFAKWLHPVASVHEFALQT